MNEEFKIFVTHWHEIALIWAEIALGFAILNFFFYLLVLTSKRKLTSKYEFLSKNEIKYFWASGLALTISFTLFINSVIIRAINTQSEFQFMTQNFVILIIGFGIGYAVYTYLNVYYPFRLEKKLLALRFKDRISKKSGKAMRLLTEDEEDVHLTEDMIEHENVNAYEYDVWKDETSGEILIEKYSGRLQQIICEKCNYRTAREVNEEVLEEPGENMKGRLKKNYQCYYCGHQESRIATIAPLTSH